MKKNFSKIILLPFLGLTLTGCNLLGDLTGQSNFSGYDEYLTKGEGLKKGNSIEDVNKDMLDYVYEWESTYVEKYNTYSYYTGRKLSVGVYDNSVTIRTLKGESISYMPGKINNFEYVLRYTDNFTGATQYIAADNSKLSNRELPVNLLEYEDGYLVVFGENNTGAYIMKDGKQFYVNDNNSTTFVGPNKVTKTIEPSELLNTCISETLVARLELPDMEGITDYYSGPSYYKDKYSNYQIYLGGVDPVQYCEVLKANGFHVERDDSEVPFLPFYGQRGGSWVATDPAHEFKIYLKFQNYLYINNSGKEFGPTEDTYINVYNSTDNYLHGRGLTTNEDWTDNEKATMAAWYDGTLNGTVPFVKMNNGYSVSSFQSYASDDLFGGNLQLHHKCYEINDDSQTYYLQNYGDILEAAGFHKYQSPNVWKDLYSKTDEFYAFYNTEECKYYNCYINQDADMAIRFGFNRSNGNQIQVFKLSTMKSWLQEAED